MTVAPPLSALVMMMSSLEDKSLSALHSFVERLSCGIGLEFASFSSLVTQDMKVSTEWWFILGVQLLSRREKSSDSEGVRLGSGFSKWALSFILLKKRCKSVLRFSRLNSPGTGQKLRFLFRSSNTVLLNTLLLRLTTVPLPSCFLSSFVERIFLIWLLPLLREIVFA